MEALLANENLIQFIKYGLAGGLATVVHICVFHLVAWKLFPALQENDHAVRLLNLKIRPINEYQRARNSMISNTIGPADLISQGKDSDLGGALHIVQNLLRNAAQIVGV